MKGLAGGPVLMCSPSLFTLTLLARCPSVRPVTLAPPFRSAALSKVLGFLRLGYGRRSSSFGLTLRLKPENTLPRLLPTED